MVFDFHDLDETYELSYLDEAVELAKTRETSKTVHVPVLEDQVKRYNANEIYEEPSLDVHTADNLHIVSISIAYPPIILDLKVFIGICSEKAQYDVSKEDYIDCRIQNHHLISVQLRESKQVRGQRAGNYDQPILIY